MSGAVRGYSPRPSSTPPAEVGFRPDVSCPDDLEAEVGAETRCTLSVEGDSKEYGVTVTVTSVEGDTANFDVKVDDEPVG